MYSVAGTTSASVDVDVSGNPVTTGTALRIPTPAARIAFQPSSDESEADREHLRHMERQRTNYRQLMASGAARPTARSPRGRLVDPPVVGDKRTIYFNYNSCNDPTQTVRIRAVYVGEHAVIWEDTTNTFQSASSASMANYYRKLGVIFDRDQYTTIKK